MVRALLRSIGAAMALVVASSADAGDYPTDKKGVDKLCAAIGESPREAVPPRDRLWFTENCVCKKEQIGLPAQLKDGTPYTTYVEGPTVCRMKKQSDTLEEQRAAEEKGKLFLKQCEEFKKCLEQNGGPGTTACGFYTDTHLCP